MSDWELDCRAAWYEMSVLASEIERLTAENSGYRLALEQLKLAKSKTVRLHVKRALQEKK